MTRREWYARTRSFTTRLVEMKDEAGRLGLWRTMHALDHPVKVTGYEQADIIEGKQVQPWRQK